MKCEACNGTGQISTAERVTNLLRGTIGALDAGEITAACRYLGRAQEALDEAQGPPRTTTRHRVALAIYAIDRDDYNEAAHYLTEAIDAMG